MPSKEDDTMISSTLIVNERFPERAEAFFQTWNSVRPADDADTDRLTENPSAQLEPLPGRLL